MPTIATMEYVHVGTSGAEKRPGRTNVAGSAQEITATLRAYEEAGLEHLICSFVADDLDDLLRQMRILSQEVMPHFAE